MLNTFIIIIFYIKLNKLIIIFNLPPNKHIYEYKCDTHTVTTYLVTSVLHSSNPLTHCNHYVLTPHRYKTALLFQAAVTMSSRGQ